MKLTGYLRCWVLLAFLANAGSTQAQSSLRGLPPLDTVQARLRRPSLPDTSRVLLLGQRASIVELDDPAKAAADARAGLALARRIGFRYGEALLLRILSRISLTQGDNKKAVGYAREVLWRAGQEPRTALIRVLALQDIAEVNSNEENYPVALAYYRQVLAGFEAIKVDPALGYAPMVTSYIADVYRDWYEQHPADSLAQGAIRYGRRALRLFEAQHHQMGMAASLRTLGTAYLNLRQLDSAALYLRRSLLLSRQEHHIALVLTNALYLADCYSRQGGHQAEVEALAKEGLALSRQVDHPTGQITAYDLLAKVYGQSGRWQQAVEALQARNVIQDTLVSQERRETISRLSTEFDTERKENRIRSLTQERQVQQARAAQQQARLWGLLAGLGLLALGLGGAVWVLRRTRRLNRRLDEQRRQLAVQAEQLTELDRAKTQFFANISHELRTPLTLIVGPVEQLLAEPPAPLAAPVRERLALVLRNGQRLQSLVNSILDLTKLTAGKLEIRPVPVRTASFLRQVTGMFESLAVDRGLTLTADVQLPEELTVLIDPDRAEVIVANLLINALKFTPKGGRVTLTARPTGQPDTYRVTVTDTGPGIAPDEQERVFERFYQSRSRRGQGGTGIGLALSRELAELLGGDLTLQSVLGEGSTFTFSFRAAAAPAGLNAAGTTPPLLPTLSAAGEAVPADEPDEAPAERPGGGRPRLLIVEDNADLRVYLRQILGVHYDVLEAENGRAALDILARESVDLISSDAMMPEMDGTELLTHVKAHDQWRRLPFLMLTARADAEHRLNALELGVDDYLPKPFLARELLARVRNLLVNYHERLRYTGAGSEEPGAGSEERGVRREETGGRRPEPGGGRQETQQGGADETADQADTLATGALRPDSAPSTGSGAADVAGALSEDDALLLGQLHELTPVILNDSDYSPADLAARLGVGERTLYRRLKTLTGLTPAAWLREVRLDQARRLLESRSTRTVAEVAYDVGFTNPDYFGQVYYKRFGKRPSEYLY